MRNFTRLIGLFITAALLVSVAAAQDASFQWDPSMPSDLPLPDSESAVGMIMTAPRAPGDNMTVGPEQGAPFEGYQPDSGGHFAPELEGLWHDPPAPIESTGTWLRRGFWYVETEAVAWNRMWNRDDKLMAAQDPNVNSPTFFSRLNPVIIFDTNRLMYLESSHPGRDTSVRATLGNFLFRDARNRDHALEFTAFGGGDWEQAPVMSSTVPFGMHVPFYIDGDNRSFDNSTRQSINYESHYSSFELNYRVRSRLGRDQLVMDPNGHWHRAANAGFEREYLVGLRMMEMRDIMDWRAEDIFAAGRDGQYLIRTDNDLYGFQMGAGLSYQAPRWSLGANAKGGVFLNDALNRSVLDFTFDDTGDADLRMAEHELSFIGEFKLLGRWHITPSFSVRAAYEVMYLSSVALAPSQATFVTDTSYINTTGDPLYHGASFGFEGYW